MTQEIITAISDAASEVPGKIIKLDPVIYENGPIATPEPFHYFLRGSLYGLTEYQAHDGKVKHIVPFAIEIGYSIVEPNFYVKLKPLYCWNANDPNDLSYWGQVVMTNNDAGGLLYGKDRPQYLQDTDKYGYQPAVDPQKVRTYLEGHGVESTTAANGATAQFSADPEFQAFLNRFYEVEPFDVPNLGLWTLNEKEVTKIISEHNQAYNQEQPAEDVKIKTQQQAKATLLVNAITADAKAAFKACQNQYGFIKGNLDLNNLQPAVKIDLLLANNFDYLKQQSPQTKLREYQVLLLEIKEQEFITFKIVSRKTIDGKNHHTGNGRFELVRDDKELASQLCRLPEQSMGSLKELITQLKVLPKAEKGPIALNE